MNIRMSASACFSLLAIIAMTGCVPVTSQAGDAPASPASAQSIPTPDLSGNDPHWLKATNVQCWAYDQSPQANETINWDGGCEGQLLSGGGTLSWYNANNTLEETDAGTFNGGQLEGADTITRYDSNGIKTNNEESTFINEKANGLEKVNRFYPSGNVSMTFVGEASNGQLNGEGTAVSFYTDGTIGASYKGIWRNGTLESIELGEFSSRATI